MLRCAGALAPGRNAWEEARGGVELAMLPWWGSSSSQKATALAAKKGEVRGSSPLKMPALFSLHRTGARHHT
jgi:hypothetical protein